VKDVSEDLVLVNPAQSRDVTTLDQNGNDQNVSQEVKNEMPQLQGK
jgi:hypothetical protein